MTMTAAQYRDQEVLDYLRDEALKPGTSKSLAGLTLDQYRAARTRLANKGLAVKNSDGRWIPTSMQTKKERDAA